MRGALILSRHRQGRHPACRCWHPAPTLKLQRERISEVTAILPIVRQGDRQLNTQLRSISAPRGDDSPRLEGDDSWKSLWED